jgi:cytochrome bd-type quinol oxidase subunit 2
MRTFTSRSTIRVLWQDANIHKNGVYRIVVTWVVSTMSSFVSSDNNNGGGKKAADHDPNATKLTCSDRMRRWGDIGHVATLISTVVFAVSVVTLVDPQKNDGSHDQHGSNDNNETGISNNRSSSIISFDEQWQREGFCVAHPETPSLSSHAVCLYVDVLLAVVVALTYWPHRHRTALRHANLLVSTNVLATIGHGLAHGGLAYHMYQQLQQQQTGMANEDAAVQTKETATMLDWFVLPAVFGYPS